MARVSEDSKVTIDTEEYVNGFTASMMEATFAWSNGANFSEVCALSGTRRKKSRVFDVIICIATDGLAWCDAIMVCLSITFV